MLKKFQKITENKNRQKKEYKKPDSLGIFFERSSSQSISLGAQILKFDRTLNFPNSKIVKRKVLLRILCFVI